MLSLHDLRPHPLVSLGINPDSQVFATECELKTDMHYLVVAPSGKGKSTFLHCLYGLRNDYEGQIEIDGRVAGNLTADEWAHLRQESLSIVFQDIRLFGQLTARENISLNNDLTGIRRMEEIVGMAERLGVRPLLDRKAARLSYGQQQRMAIIRALCQPFKFLLLDEPFSHLDAANTQLALQLIVEVCEEQKAGLVLVSLGEDYDHAYDAVMEL